MEKAEYLIGMLVAMEAVDPVKLKLYSDKFDELDADGSGKLDAADLAILEDQMRASTKGSHHSIKVHRDKAPPPCVDLRTAKDARDPRAMALRRKKSGLDAFLGDPDLADGSFSDSYQLEELRDGAEVDAGEKDANLLSPMPSCAGDGAPSCCVA